MWLQTATNVHSLSVNQNNNSRKRQIILSNPSFSSNISTNMARIFPVPIDKHFLCSHKLNKIFKKNTIRVSYNCMGNFTKIIKGHNKKATKNNTKDQLDCNCRIKEQCLVKESCRKESVMHFMI